MLRPLNRAGSEALQFNYNSKAWKRKRRHILNRDGYLCQECSRYGKRIDADTVHHIYPVEEYPQFAFCDWNLISLSLAAHDEMHDRITHKLTPKGLAWQQRRRREFEAASGISPHPKS